MIVGQDADEAQAVFNLSLGTDFLIKSIESLTGQKPVTKKHGVYIPKSVEAKLQELSDAEFEKIRRALSARS